MRVRVRFFATFREIAGARELPWTVREDVRLVVLVDAVLAKYPKLADHRPTMLVAVNHELARPDVVLRDGDEIAFLPPVSGGAR